ncbi:hypothetical protein CEXT_16551 [Caerostris extrusa]|uniref:Uncharacterized protein n=1 Tax=Caerostris extrusa TaxID=172846 RepID=A0AAV4RPD3_CAEEX|nr:hypothetical protein CEXT_16551 [Caerostris extrusa]
MTFSPISKGDKPVKAVLFILLRGVWPRCLKKVFSCARNICGTRNPAEVAFYRCRLRFWYARIGLVIYSCKFILGKVVAAGNGCEISMAYLDIVTLRNCLVLEGQELARSLP